MNVNDSDSQQYQEYSNLENESIADQLLIDAMLQVRSKDGHRSTSQRVEKACKAIDKIHHNYFWYHWITKVSAAAAAIILILGIIQILNSPPTAHADFTAILEAFDTGDQTYQIDILKNTEEPEEITFSLKSPRRGGIVKNLDGASLYIRQNRYVLKYRTTRGRGITRGFDGRENWLLHHHRRQTIVNNDPNSLPSEIPDYIHSLLFLDLRSMLHEIQEKYKLSGPESEILENESNPMQYFIAARISRQSRMPAYIELWFDPATKEIRRILFREISFYRARSPRYSLQFRLISTDPLPENWFTPQAHQ